ncbi:zinc finger CCCH domain-containing protein 22 isoform X2 [Ipomoea triloba]|uniref:zinc finger CCCH domain-containing protein 22 isoform X2 n=1 Tax=Ipomoea triloba TaxID=35885 RepID=UPI00125E9785|nr:zinc finger CCCH domain-containing protein 22 isoform X2 [Ipomoea triloba]
MANNEEEERSLEEQLELQLQEQNDSLRDLTEALSSDPSNIELLSVQEELIQSIKEVEEGLLHLKRARLLREVDNAIQGSKNFSKDAKVEPLDPKVVAVHPFLDQNYSDVEAEPHAPVDPNYSVGSKCRFRSTDGRWYNGLIVQLEGSNSALVSFLTPTSESMLVGIDVPKSSLKKFVPTVWGPSMVGSSIWALADSKVGLWREAELESWDENLKLGRVVFRDNGSCIKLGVESISLSEYAEVSDEEESCAGSEQSDSSDYEEEDSPRGLGFVESTNLQSGVQTETTLFAKWENHTRGIASKMMANMGYHEGMGLGATGQGILDPISVRVLPSKQSLDHAVEGQKNEEAKEHHGKKRSRGGKRKREKRFAEAARAAKEEEELKPDVFSLINSQLAVHAESLNGSWSCSKKHENKGESKKEGGRRGLLAYEDEIKELRMRVEKLEEMVNRNRREKVVFEAAMRKLNETRKALSDAEAAHASASSEVVNKEKEKRWLKF